MKQHLIGLYSPSMRSGKSTVAHNLTFFLFGTVISFAEPLYKTVIDVASPFIGSVEETKAWLMDDRKDNKPVPTINVTLRYLLQTLGTKWGRELIHYDLWTLIAEQKAKNTLNSYSVVFDDMRFPNEFAMVQRLGGKTIKIIRPGDARGDTGIGEGLLDKHEFDYVLINDGTLQELRSEVYNIAGHMKDV